MERDARGLPIPANLSRATKNGKPNFAIRDVTAEIELFCSQKCSVTGSLLDEDDVWFITTPNRAFLPFLQLLEAPMCGEAKDFTLRVCPYFGIRNYQRLTDEQAKAMAPEVSNSSYARRYETPNEYVAVRVTGFHGEPNREGMLYLPCRHYVSVEFWEEQNCRRVIDGDGVRAEIVRALAAASALGASSHLPDWAKMSLDGSLNGRWPWAQPGLKDALLDEARRLT